ncbi:MAG TPA: TonB family protein [Candidatus Angelobacter sp.]|nr:TonB family protein [Candidatus Angelobacter sp.]
MNGQGSLNRRWRRFIHGQTVPDSRILLGSIVVHCLVLAALTVVQLVARQAPVIVFPETRTARGRPAAVYLPPAARRSPLQMAQKNARPRSKPRNPGAEVTDEGLTGERLRERARLETKALIQNFKFRTTFGFSPFPRYELPFQMSGQVPSFPADQFPPHFEQYVVVEITIDTSGHVADARITAGDVAPTIQQSLLSAIREFKYRPATREGIPVPSQVDVVVHIPT